MEVGRRAAGDARDHGRVRHAIMRDVELERGELPDIEVEIARGAHALGIERTHPVAERVARRADEDALVRGGKRGRWIRGEKHRLLAHERHPGGATTRPESAPNGTWLRVRR